MQAVHTAMTRVTFVKGWLTGGSDPADGSVESGDYTQFPIEVTGADNAEKLDKIAELYHRVKFAQFTINELWDMAYGGPSGVGYGDLTPRVQAFVGSGLGEEQMMNGYWTLDTVTYPCYPASLDYLDEAYSVTFTSLPGSGYTADFRDLSTKERGILLPKQDGYFPIWNEMMPNPPELNGLNTFYDTVGGLSNVYGADEQNFRTAFSWYSQSDIGTVLTPTMPIPYISQDNGFGIVYEQMEVMVEWTGYVSVVRDNPNNADYGVGNRYFLGVRVRIRNGFGEEATANEIGSLSTTSASYVIRLSTGDISCPLASSDASLSGDLIHEATEWFPYAKASPAAPVWNTATGVKL